MSLRVFRNPGQSAHRCPLAERLRTLHAMEGEMLRSGDAVFRCGDDLRIVEWNGGAERLTGVPAREAVGSYCWDAIAGRDDDGNLVCHSGCSIARLAREGWPVSCTNLVRSGPDGLQRVSISTIVLRSRSRSGSGSGSGATILHPMRAAPLEPARSAPTPPVRRPRLTGRQLEVLGFLAGGVRVHEIAARLSLSETTVRNHVRAVLSELGVHSQLEAVARARDLALL